MLTGDNRKTAEAVAAQVGITDARGDMLPQDKLKAIEKLAALGPPVDMAHRRARQTHG